MPQDSSLNELPSSAVLKFNALIGAADRLIAVRGLRGPTFGIVSAGPWAITARFSPAGATRLTVNHLGREVFVCIWPEHGHPGHVQVDEPGAWRAELLAFQPYDS